MEKVTSTILGDAYSLFDTLSPEIKQQLLISLKRPDIPRNAIAISSSVLGRTIQQDFILVRKGTFRGGAATETPSKQKIYDLAYKEKNNPNVFYFLCDKKTTVELNALRAKYDSVIQELERSMTTDYLVAKNKAPSVLESVAKTAVSGVRNAFETPLNKALDEADDTRPIFNESAKTFKVRANDIKEEYDSKPINCSGALYIMYDSDQTMLGPFKGCNVQILNMEVVGHYFDDESQWTWSAIDRLYAKDGIKDIKQTDLVPPDPNQEGDGSLRQIMKKIEKINIPPIQLKESGVLQHREDALEKLNQFDVVPEWKTWGGSKTNYLNSLVRYYETDSDAKTQLHNFQSIKIMDPRILGGEIVAKRFPEILGDAKIGITARGARTELTTFDFRDPTRLFEMRYAPNQGKIDDSDYEVSSKLTLFQQKSDQLKEQKEAKYNQNAVTKNQLYKDIEASFAQNTGFTAFLGVFFWRAYSQGTREGTLYPKDFPEGPWHLNVTETETDDLTLETDSSNTTGLMGIAGQAGDALGKFIRERKKNVNSLSDKGYKAALVDWWTCNLIFPVIAGVGVYFASKSGKSVYHSLTSKRGNDELYDIDEYTKNVLRTLNDPEFPIELRLLFLTELDPELEPRTVAENLEAFMSLFKDQIKASVRKRREFTTTKEQEKEQEKVSKGQETVNRTIAIAIKRKYHDITDDDINRMFTELGDNNNQNARDAWLTKWRADKHGVTPEEWTGLGGRRKTKRRYGSKRRKIKKKKNTRRRRRQTIKMYGGGGVEEEFLWDCMLYNASLILQFVLTTSPNATVDIMYPRFVELMFSLVIPPNITNEQIATIKTKLKPYILNPDTVMPLLFNM